jgi:hypothetical protein
MGTAKARFQDNAGMTVVEVIIALGIVTVGLVALIAAMPLSTSLIGESNLKTTGTFLAQQRMEQIKNAQWTAAPLVDNLGGGGSDGTAAVAQWPDEDYDTIAFPGAANCGATDRSGGCRFRRQVRISDCSVVSCSGIPIGTVNINTLRQVTVKLFFRPLAGTGMTQATEESVRLVTLITQRL